jgi:DNA-binding transcriptional LysR family regulator
MEWESRLGRRFRLRDLYILSIVVERGSMAKAATLLRMSQPSISEAVAKLEDTLRVRLLDRGPRGIEPTIYARALLKRGSVVFDELREAIKTSASWPIQQKGRCGSDVPKHCLASSR